MTKNNNKLKSSQNNKETRKKNPKNKKPNKILPKLRSQILNKSIKLSSLFYFNFSLMKKKKKYSVMKLWQKSCTWVSITTLQRKSAEGLWIYARMICRMRLSGYVSKVRNKGPPKLFTQLAKQL